MTGRRHCDRPRRRPVEPVRARQAGRADRRPAAARARDRGRPAGRRRDPRGRGAGCARRTLPGWTRRSSTTRRLRGPARRACWRDSARPPGRWSSSIGGDMPALVAAVLDVDDRGARRRRRRRRRPRARRSGPPAAHRPASRAARRAARTPLRRRRTATPGAHRGPRDRRHPPRRLAPARPRRRDPPRHRHARPTCRSDTRRPPSEERRSSCLGGGAGLAGDQTRYGQFERIGSVVPISSAASARRRLVDTAAMRVAKARPRGHDRRRGRNSLRSPGRAGVHPGGRWPGYAEPRRSGPLPCSGR